VSVRSPVACDGACLLIWSSCAGRSKALSLVWARCCGMGLDATRQGQYALVGGRVHEVGCIAQTVSQDGGYLIEMPILAGFSVRAAGLAFGGVRAFDALCEC